MEKKKELTADLAKLKAEHRDLDQAINTLLASRDSDYLELQRLKKRKLAIKDRIICLQSKLLPDIIA